MTITQLIRHLAQVRATHGNLRVGVLCTKYAELHEPKLEPGKPWGWQRESVLMLTAEGEAMTEAKAPGRGKRKPVK